MNQEFVMMFSGSESERIGDASADVAADGMIAALYNEVQQSLQTRTETKIDGQVQEAVALKDCSALGSESVTPPVNVTNTSAGENLQFVDETHSSDPDHSSVRVKTIEIPDSWKISILESNGASSHNVEPVVEKHMSQLWECSRCDALFREKELCEKHTRSSHEFLCGLCNEPFQEKEAFENHVIRHISEIPGHALQKITIGTFNNASSNEKTENLNVSKFGKGSIVKSPPESLVKSAKCDSLLTFSSEMCLESPECHDYDSEAAEKGLHFTNSSNSLIKKGSDVKAHSEKQVCDVCGKVCFTKNSLLLHMTKKHRSTRTSGKNFICSECGKSFKWKLSLQNHQVVHHGKGKFP